MTRTTVMPAAVVCPWVDHCLTPTTADNSGNAVTNPGSLASAARLKHSMDEQGTTLLVRLKYAAGGSPTAATPVVQVFGFDAAGLPEPLLDYAGAHPLTFTAAPASDVTDGTWKYTVSQEVDVNGNASVLATIKTALAGTSLGAATIQVRAK